MTTVPPTRMVTPARRGHPELAWGNVVGTVVVLLTLNLGIIAMVSPGTADPLVLGFHVSYLVAPSRWPSHFFSRRRLGRWMGAALVSAYGLYLGLNVSQMWR